MSSINATIRAFVALDLPGEVKAALSETSHRLAAQLGVHSHAVRWTKPEAIHLTLQFLGDVPIGMQQLLKEAIARGCDGQRAAEVSLDGLGVFPNPKRPRVLWVGIEGDEASMRALNSLQAAISNELSTLGFKPDKGFRPHLTLGRGREPATDAEIEYIGRCIARATDHPLVKCTFMLDEVNLVKSELRPTGSLYTPLAVVPLRSRT